MSDPVAPRTRRSKTRVRPLRSGWRQDALIDEPAGSNGGVRIPAPLYHERLRVRAEAARTRRARRQRLRQLAQILLVTLLVAAGALVVVRLLSAMETPAPDAGGVVNLLRPEPAVGQANRPADAAEPLPAFIENPFTQPAEAPSIGASAALLVDLGDRTILYAQNAHERRAPASLAKLATAIVAIEQAPPDTRIQVPPEAAAQPPNTVGLRPGDVLTLQDLLFAMLLPSGNDAAVSVADGIGGEPYVVAQMNDLARRLSLQNTRFSNSVGYDADDQYSTAFDLTVLAADAIERFPLLARIVATKARMIPPGPANRTYAVTNLNGLLWSYAGTVGVKTGRTEGAGGNIIAAAHRDGRRLMAVVLGSSDRIGDARTLLDYGFRALAAAG